MFILFFRVCVKQILSTTNLVAEIKFVFILIWKHFGFATMK